MNDNDDKTGYKKTAEGLGVKKDYKMTFTAMAIVWLWAAFLSMIAISSVFSSINFWVRIALSAAAGVIITPVMFYLVLPRMDKERSYFKKITFRFNSEGMSHELAAEIDAHLRVTGFTDYNKSYFNMYLQLLIVYNLNMMNFPECMRLLDLTDKQVLQELYRYPTGKQEMVTHHYLRILTVSQMGDLHALEYFYGDASRIFHECRGLNRLADGMIDESRAMREIAHGRLNDAESIMQPYANEPAIRQDYCSIVGRCAALLGDRERAGKLFDEAYSLAKNDFQRESVQRERNSLSV